MHVNFLHDAPAIRFATFLAPNLYCTYEHIARYVGVKVGYPTRLRVGHSLEDLVAGQVDVGFICGLPYVRLVDSPGIPVELLAAPVLQGASSETQSVSF